jgi:hypothetical protein
MMSSSDPKREEIKQQILDWISQEKDWKVELFDEKVQEEENNYYFYSRVILSENTNCNVAIEKNVERVNVMVNAAFAKDDASSYKLSRDRHRFWIDMRISLAQMGVNVAAIPNVEELAGLQVSKLIYFDGWSHDKFIETLLKVTDGLIVAEFYFKNFADSMRRRHGDQKQ